MDLWPLGLMRRRAGEAPVEAEVVRPTSFAEVRRLLRGGRKVVPLGGGSGVCGAVLAVPGGVVLDLGGLDQIEIDEANLLVRAQAGARAAEVERRLEERGLTLGHFPSSLPVATIGGLVSIRSSGQESTRYGSIEDMLLALTVALPDGTLAEARVVPRSAAGPALHQLFCGAEGGLGVVLEAVLRVHRRPAEVVGRGWRLGDVEAGLAAMREVLQQDLRPQVLRLYDPEDSLVQGEPEGCLLVGATAGPASLARSEAELLASTVAAAGGALLGEAPWERWLRHRFDLSAERMREVLEPPGAYLDTIEVAATWSRLPQLYRKVKAHLADTAQLALCHFSHASGQGACAYFTFAGSAPDEAGAEATYLEAWRGAMEETLAAGGTITHHHGVGRLRARWMPQEMRGWWQVWEAVRHAFDPEASMNPGALGGGGPIG
ncbi:MAG: FAD-binding oxidoreductase [Candidatus Dormibacteraeota bacterium]|nr:FAD-binding oxidoreductase [Candidatus Dormibacteraeota bacterium]